MSWRILLAILMLAFSTIVFSVPQDTLSASTEFAVQFRDIDGELVEGGCLVGDPWELGYVCDNLAAWQLELVLYPLDDLDLTAGVIRFEASQAQFFPATYVAIPPEGYTLSSSQQEDLLLSSAHVEGRSVVPIVTLEARTEGVFNERGQTCTLVELRPGYPEYRGYVTGIAGAGEAACQEDLEANYSWFSKEFEDSENLSIARSLGVTGSAEEWVWETWMAIGAQRGLGHICYVCIWTGNDPNPLPAMRIDVAPDDPRMQLTGMYGEWGYTQTYATANNIPISRSSNGIVGEWLPKDWELRAIVALLWQDPFPTATQLEIAADDYLSNLLIDPFIPASSFFWGSVVDRGGYYPGSSEMLLDDQIYLIDLVRGMEYWYRSGAMALPTYQAVSNLLQRDQDQFVYEFSHGNFDSYADYVRWIESQN